MTRLTCFDTPIGRCGLGWKEGRLVAFALPAHDEAALLSTLRARDEHATLADPDPIVASWVEAIVAHLSGRLRTLEEIPLATERVTPKRAHLYAAARSIRPGQVVTYGELAQRTGTIARAVGQAMAQNPWPLVVPCHRVVAANALPGGFSAPGGLATKRRLLELEGALLPGHETGSLFEPR